MSMDMDNDARILLDDVVAFCQRDGLGRTGDQHDRTVRAG